MNGTNPFDGIKTYGNYRQLWGLTAVLVLLHFAVLLPIVLIERRTGFRFTSIEGMVPVFLAIIAASLAVLSSMGVGWRGALAEWRRGFAADARKALKYFGGYLLLMAGIVAALTVVWLLAGDSAMTEAVRPMTERSLKEGEMLRTAFGSPLRLLAAAACSCLLAPVAEELYFRRIFYTTLRRRGGFWFSAFWSGLFFALGHGAAAPALLPVGIYFCWVYERERRLPVNIMLHSLINVFMFALRMYD